MIYGYIAASVDGFIADAEGGVGWLEAFTPTDTGYEAFIGEMDAVIMGRKTYDQIIGFDVAWPYAGKDCYVVTSSPLAEIAGDAVAWHEGSKALAQRITDKNQKAWLVGGAALQAAFIREDLMAWIDLFLMPVLLGAGVPLFPSDGPPQSLNLMEQDALQQGIMRLRYAPD